jgi:hypothetical protein
MWGDVPDRRRRFALDNGPWTLLSDEGDPVTDDEWEEQRNRAIMTAFQTGRAVFADSAG